MTIKSDFDLGLCFQQLRLDPNHHLGLGDIRLTLAQQEEIVARIEQKLYGVSGKRPYYQLCPKCLGEGQVPNIGNLSSLFRVCPVCNGSRTLYVDLAACASGAVDTVAEGGVKYCEWCQLETPIKDDKCSECGKPCAEVL